MLWFQKGSETMPRPLIPACVRREAGVCHPAHPLELAGLDREFLLNILFVKFSMFFSVRFIY